MSWEAKRNLFASVLLWPFLAAALAACWGTFPIANQTNRLQESHDDPTHNWIVQGVSGAYFNALLLMIVVYAAKFFIGSITVRWVRVYCFVLLVIASLPYIWLLVVLDWRNAHV